MTLEDVQAYAKARGFHPKTVARLLGWEAAARAALSRLVVSLKISENHLRDLLDWLEEAAVRDGCGIEAILADKVIENIETDPRLGRADKLKRIKDEVRRRRFPRLAQAEDALSARIGELKLLPEIVLSAPAGLEGGRLHVEFGASSQEELQRLAAKLAEAAEREPTRAIFALLSGTSEPTLRVDHERLLP